MQNSLYKWILLQTLELHPHPVWLSIPFQVSTHHWTVQCVSLQVRADFLGVVVSSMSSHVWVDNWWIENIGDD
jgi:hypothetical protein